MDKLNDGGRCLRDWGLAEHLPLFIHVYMLVFLVMTLVGHSDVYIEADLGCCFGLFSLVTKHVI